jgi:hypothetical protein
MTDKLHAGPYWGNDAIDPSFATNQRLPRDENERWREIVATFSAGNAALEAENERLKREYDALLEAGKRHAHALVVKVDEARAEAERLRTALREALEKATACAPPDRLHELEPLWSVLDD